MADDRWLMADGSVSYLLSAICHPLSAVKRHEPITNHGLRITLSHDFPPFPVGRRLSFMQPTSQRTLLLQLWRPIGGRHMFGMRHGAYSGREILPSLRYTCRSKPLSSARATRTYGRTPVGSGRNRARRARRDARRTTIQRT